MHVSDNLYLGNFGPGGLTLVATSANDPTLNQGVGPMGRIAFMNFIPLTVQTANIAALQAPTASTAMTLAAGTGATSTTSPDGLGRTVIAFDVPRAVSLTSTANLSGGNYTITGYDQYGQYMSQVRAGPNNNTVNTLKAFKSVYTVTPTATSASTVSVGSSDIFGFPYAILDVGYLVSVRWAQTLAQDAGTFVAAVTTDPSTTALGDVRGTYLPSSASNGTRRLVIGMHLTASQCGPAATVAGLLGVAQV